MIGKDGYLRHNGYDLTPAVQGYVHRQPQYLSEKCRRTMVVNNIGMRSSRDLPIFKKPDEFAIMIVGGSVAEQFANYQRAQGPYYFEDLLNKVIKLPNGRKFKVYNGALGGWSMPNQLHMLEMYGDRIDGIIAIDGYNEAATIEKGERLEQVFPDLQILSNSRFNGFNQLYLRTLWALEYGLSHKIIKHSYFFNVSYQIMIALFQNVILSPDLLDEFSKGNQEKMNMPKKELVEWSMNSLKRYIKAFHQLAKFNKIASAHFLQPTRLYGKTLTEKEKRPKEYIHEDTYRLLESTYLSLKREHYPIQSLTNLFENERGQIYSDHIHYIKDENNISVGNELMDHSIANFIKRNWAY